MARAAAFFDLDKTIIAKSSTLVMGKPFFQGGLISRRAILKSTYAQLVYSLAGADEDQMDRMRDYLAELCRGWDAEQVQGIVDETLHDLIDPLVYDEAVSLIEEHHAAGRDVVIVSSSGEEIVRAVGVMVGADHTIGTRMEVEDGKYTGVIDFYAYGPHKASAIIEVAATCGYDLADCYAYSDSATDLPMLEVVGHPVAVNPDKPLRRAATERGWPILEFRRPVSLRSRISALPRPSRPVLASAAVGVGAAAIGWHLLSRRSRSSN
jgi:HAD superfamily hydrolase (TIGR01490 family)